MAKPKTQYFCQSCGQQSAKWAGQCPACKEWNTFVEEVVVKESKPNLVPKKGIAYAKPFNEIAEGDHQRFVLQDPELNRVLGGGVVPGSLVLVGGEPGIGKSTLMLQLALDNPGLKILYVSGEESETQLKMRAQRIGRLHANCLVYTETSTQAIFQQVKQVEPDLLVIDSIQTLQSPYIESSAGSVSQIRECTSELMRLSKERGIPSFIIGHITKDGHIAGPKVLEHMVDTVLQFEGDRNHLYRLLRCVKNRFGSTHELGIYEMTGGGLVGVENPSQVLIGNRDESLSGIAIAASIEGLRPMLIEIQALVSSAVYGTPQRSATGFDLRRLNMLLAVMEKRCGFNLASKDVFLNLAGGIRVDDPAIDLAIVVAILSSAQDIAVSPQTAFAAEVGLSGEVRPVPKVDQRIEELQKLGFSQVYISDYTANINDEDFQIIIVRIKKVEEAFRLLFA